MARARCMFAACARAHHFGLTRNPSSIAPRPRHLFMSERHCAALPQLLYGTALARDAAGGAGGGYELFNGNIGSGKTTKCRSFMQKISGGRRAARQRSAVDVFKGIGASGAQFELI